MPSDTIAREAAAAASAKSAKAPSEKGRSSAAFDIDATIEKFRKCADEIAETQQLRVEIYVEAMRELMKIFGCFGSSIEFAFKDLNEKVAVLEKYAEKYPTGTAGDGLRFDVLEKNQPPNDKAEVKLAGGGGKKVSFGKCSVSRALNRTGYVCLFVKSIFKELNTSPDASLKDCVKTAYGKSLANIHGWVVRASVNTAFSVGLPDRAAFLKDCRILNDELEPKGKALYKACHKVAAHLKAQHEAVDTPWEF